MAQDTNHEAVQRIHLSKPVSKKARILSGIHRTNDTLLPPNDSLNYIKTQRAEVRTENFFDMLEEKANRKKWMRELHNIVISSPKQKNNHEALTTQKSELPFVPFTGKVIRSIQLKKLNVFGPTISDTTKKATSWLEKAGNKLHFKTADWVLKQNMIIHVGDTIDPLVMSDNERLLRELPYIEDARIYVTSKCVDCDSVDVVVITKDLWSKGFHLDFSDINAGRVEVWDKNIFGFGHETQSNLYWDGDKKAALGYMGTYGIRNIAGTFIHGKITYSNIFEDHSYGIEFNRQFFTPNTKYAGGASFYRISTFRDVRYYDTLSIITPVDYNDFSFWVGRSFKVNTDNFFLDNRASFILAGAVYRNKYFKRPVVEKDLNYTYQNKTQLLGTIAYSRQDFYRSNLIYSFGRTEDIPYGSLINFTFGPEFNEFYTRLYYGLSLSKGDYLFNLGYLQGSAQYGGFIHNNKLEQGIIKCNLNYFTNLFILNRFKIRQFAKFDFTKGIHRFGNEYITINDLNGIPGLTSPDLLGIKKMTLNLETVTFSPYYLYGFRFAFFGSVNMGLIGDRYDKLFNQQLTTGLSIGIRIRNERLVFNTFQVKFTLYPGAPANARRNILILSGESRLQPENFYVKAPQIIKFK